MFKMYEAAPGIYIPEGQTLESMHQGDAMADQVLSITGQFMDEPESKLKPTKTTWVTRENEEIPVVEMGDMHLINTIRMLRRKAMYLQLGDVLRINDYIADAPDGAAMCAEEVAGQIGDMTDENYLAYKIPCYLLMLREAAERNLNLEVPPPSE